jgi:hypothetical protein
MGWTLRTVAELVELIATNDGRTEFWKQFLLLAGDSPEERGSALGNAALQFHNDCEYRLSADLYRLAQELLPRQDY